MVDRRFATFFVHSFALGAAEIAAQTRVKSPFSFVGDQGLCRFSH